MASADVGLYSLNAGEISRLGLARIDLAKLKMAAEQQLNLLPHVLGPAMVRPGTAYQVRTQGDLAVKFVEFYLDETTKALLVLTPAIMRILTGGAYVTRVAVTATVTNGTFTTDLSGWTDSDEAGTTSAWVAGGFMSLTGTGVNFAWRDQEITVTEPNVEHALRVVVAHGTVAMKLGTALGGDSYWDLTLLPGTYSLAFVPTGNFWIRLGAGDTFPAFVDSIAIEAAGIVELPVPYDAGDLPNIFYDQSEDVVFVACKGFQQRRIEHRAPKGAVDSNVRSWSVALYLSDDGPFLPANLGPVTLAPNSVVGVATLTASRAFFQAGHAGALFRLRHLAQTATALLGGLGQFTSEVRVSGLTAVREIAIEITGVFNATVVLQRSLGVVGAWTDIESYTVPTAKTYNDNLDNQIVYYRLGIPTTYVSGAANSTLFYHGSIQTGICRITSVTNETTAVADVLENFGATTATGDWDEGQWSDLRGWPAAVALHDGRLSWDLGVHFNASVSDAFSSYDDRVEGDAGPINRVIATGGRDGVRWLMSLERLIAGTAAQEISIRASSFDEPLTPTAFVARVAATRGVARIRPLRVDKIGVYVSRDSQRIFELVMASGETDYASRELTRLKQEMCAAGVTSCAVQRHPDTRLWFTLADGTCAVLTYDREEEVMAWTPTDTLGTYEQVGVLPGSPEDDVFFSVARTIDGVTQRFIEKLAWRSEVAGGTLSKTSDAHIVYQGAATATISVSHLPGREVAVWADGAPLATLFTVSAGGVLTLPAAVSNAVVGLPYTAKFKSVKPAYVAEHGTALTMQKRISQIGLVMADVSWKGVRIGRDFTHLSGLPATYRGRVLAANEVMAAYDARPSGFTGSWDSDSRVCISVSSPHCATIMALVLEMTTNEPNDEPNPAPRNA